MANTAEIRKHNVDLLKRIQQYAADILKAVKSIKTEPTPENIQDKIHDIEMVNHKMRLCADQLWDP